MSTKAAPVEGDADTTITYRVPASLKHDFMSVLKRQDRNISLVLRDFMREVVQTEGRAIKAPAISDAERRRRQEAVAYGQASVALEGFPITAEAQALADSFVAGDLTLAEFAAAPHGGARER